VLQNVFKMLPVGFRHIIKFFSGGEDDITIFSQKLAVSRNIGISQLISELRASTCSAFAASGMSAIIGVMKLRSGQNSIGWKTHSGIELEVADDCRVMQKLGLVP
jgi:hypothetical protein